MNEGSHSFVDAFGLCAGELGMYSAARLFARALLAESDARAVQEVLDSLGAHYPVFDVVGRNALVQRRLMAIDPRPVLPALSGLSRLVMIGLEADCLDALLPHLPGTQVFVVPDMLAAGDLERVAANYVDRAELVELGSFQRHAGRTSGLLTVVYGSDGYRATVCQAWLRAHGPDVRARFRSIVGWNVLGPKMAAYPRWLSDTDARDFDPLVLAVGAEG